MEIKKNKGGNPNWKKGGKSPNPLGAGIKRKHSARTVKGKIESFLRRNMTPQKLQALYEGLTNPKDKLEFLTGLLPYAAAKQTALTVESQFAELSDNDLDKLLNRITDSFAIPTVVEPDIKRIDLTPTKKQQSWIEARK